MSTPIFKAKTRIQTRIGGGMREWEPGDEIALDEETIRQNLHPNDYEKVTKKRDSKPQTSKNKKEEPFSK